MTQDKDWEISKLLLEARTAFSHAAMRPLYLLNGGAIIVTLAVAGDMPQVAGALVDPVKLWIVGLFLAAVTTITGYFHQRAYSMTRFYRGQGKELQANRLYGRVDQIRWFAYLTGAASLALFGYGAWIASDSLAALAK